MTDSLSPSLTTETEPVNTPDTLGVTPRYVLQRNALSRGAHNMSATAQKVIAMAIALLPSDLSSRTASFTFADFCKAVGYERGGDNYTTFKAAVDDCMRNYIAIEIYNTETNKNEWQGFTWFTWAKVDEATMTAKMTFSSELAAALLELKKTYAKISLRDLGELQSRYALRIFQMIMSYMSLKGKDGNQELTWYCERSLADLRFMFGVPEGAYKETKHFRQYVIEEPVKEINQAELGVEIATIGVKKGRYLAAIRFECKQRSRPVAQRKGKKGKKAAPAPAPTLPDTGAGREREAKENEHLKELHPDEFAAFYAEELAKMPPVMQGHAFAQEAAAGGAFIRLREKYGILK